MFNKSILVALILCACYLGAIQADVIPTTGLLATGLQGANTAQQLAQGLPIGAPNLPPLPVLSPGKPGLLPTNL